MQQPVQGPDGGLGCAPAWLTPAGSPLRGSAWGGYFVVVPPEVVAPVDPLVPELLLVPERDGVVVVEVPDVDGGDAVPLTEPPAAPIPDAVPEAVPDTGPVLQAASAAAQASAINTLVMAELLQKMNRNSAWPKPGNGRLSDAFHPRVRLGGRLVPDMPAAEVTTDEVRRRRH
jgi:hypothetical protein